MKKLILWMVVLFVFSISISAQPPFEQTSFSDNLVVQIPQVYYFMQNSSYTFNVHVYNNTGKVVNLARTECNIDLYNHSGAEIAEHEMSKGSNDFKITINKSNFLQTGEMAVLVFCNQTNIGGFSSRNFYVTETGKEPITNHTFLLGLALMPLIVGFLFIKGAKLFNEEEHPAFRIGLFLLSAVSFLVSLWFSALVLLHYYNIKSMFDAIVGMTSMYSWVFYVFLAYIALYVLYIMLMLPLRQKKKEKETRYEND